MQTRHRRATLLAVFAVLCSPLALVGPADALPADPPGCSTKHFSYTNQNDFLIPDDTSGGVDSGVVAPVGVGEVRAVRVKVHITHSFNADVDITLKSPAGTEVTLSSDNGGSNHDVFNGTTFDDDAGHVNPPGPVTDTHFESWVAEAAVAPEEPLSQLVGENADGLWTLNVADDLPGDVGTLHDWTLELVTDAAKPPSLSSLGWGAGGLPIPDNGTPLVLTHVPLARGGTIERVRLDVNITHPHTGDLDIHLISPSGTDVTLSSGNGGANANVFKGTSFDDEAGMTMPPGPVTDTVFTSGVAVDTVSPEEPLGALRGERPDGVWTLRIVDTVPGNSGTLSNWGALVYMASCGNETTLSGSGGPASVHAGETVAYVYTANNPSIYPALDAKVSDPLPAGLELVSATPSQGTCSGSVTCSLGTIDPGYSAQVVVVARATQTGTIVNTATLSQKDPDPRPANNKVALSTTVEPAPGAPAGPGSDATNTTPAPAPAARDTQAPQLVIAVRRARLAAVRAKGLPAIVAVTEASTVRLRLAIPAKIAKKLGLRGPVGKAKRVFTTAGSVALRVKLTKRAAGALRGVKSVRFTLRGVATDAAANTSSQTAKASSAS